ncbi:hypothetical protein L4D76_01670 [Photobacterium sagamiensis]|uniref:hypothetical protein n=1 Tax=Photobacterium sagamiensis TaxID=2910241 RepID=UPI003D0A79AD
MSMKDGIKRFGKNVGRSSTTLMAAYIKDGFSPDDAKRVTDIAMEVKIDDFVEERFSEKNATEITSALSDFGKESDE